MATNLLEKVMRKKLMLIKNKFKSKNNEEKER